ncbi:MAG: membrane dipeptidase, partial [bacterium]
MLIVDGHLDLAWNALQWNRDLTRPVAELRRGPYVEVAVVSGQPPRGDIVPTVALPEMRRGGVGLCFATLLARSTGRPIAHMDFASPLQAHAVAQGQLAYYRALAAGGFLRPVASRRELDRHVAAWEAFERSRAGEAPPVGYVLAMEGADPILEPADLATWHAAGLRVLGLSHFGE